MASGSWQSFFKKKIEKKYLILGVYLQILSPETVTPMFCCEIGMFVILESCPGDEPWP